MRKQKRNNKTVETSGINSHPLSNSVKLSNSPPVPELENPYLASVLVNGQQGGDYVYDTYPGIAHRGQLQNTGQNQHHPPQLGKPPKQKNNKSSKQSSSPNAGVDNGNNWTLQPVFDYEPSRLANGQPAGVINPANVNGSAASPILYFNRPTVEVSLHLRYIVLFFIKVSRLMLSLKKPGLPHKSKV